MPSPLLLSSAGDPPRRSRALDADYPLFPLPRISLSATAPPRTSHDTVPTPPSTRETHPVACTAHNLPSPIDSPRALHPSPRPFVSYARRPEPFKYIHFPSPSEVALSVAVAPDGASVTLTCARPVKGVVLDVVPAAPGAAEAEEPRWADQALDLVPGDPQTVAVRGLAGREVRARYLGDGSA